MPKSIIILIIALLLLIGFAIKKQHTQNTQIRNECAPTDLYVIGNKGIRERVYDCSGVKIDD